MMSPASRPADASDDGPDPAPPFKVDTTRPHSARVWNYWLGGKDNYQVDRQAGDRVLALVPEMTASARADRAFLARAVRYMVAEAGIIQFLDVGTGLPTVDNTHEVAQRLAPHARIVYVDNDHLVLAHARALLTSSPQGACDYVKADLRDPARIVYAAGETLDFTQPIGLIMLGIVHHITDDEQARAVVRHLIDALPSGSHVAVAYATDQVASDRMHEAIRVWLEAGGTPIKARPPAEMAAYLADCKLVDPGIISCSLWRPEATPFGEPKEVPQYCAVGYKP